MAKVPVLTRAPDPCDRTRETHDGQDLSARPHSCITTRARGIGNYLHLEAEARSCVEDPHDYGNADREQEAERQREAVDTPARPGCLRRERLSLREDARLEPSRLAQVGVAVEDQILEDEPHDVVEHQR